MVEVICCICLNEINDDIHHFDESELEKKAHPFVINAIMNI